MRSWKPRRKNLRKRLTKWKHYLEKPCDELSAQVSLLSAFRMIRPYHYLYSDRPYYVKLKILNRQKESPSSTPNYFLLSTQTVVIAAGELLQHCNQHCSSESARMRNKAVNSICKKRSTACAQNDSNSIHSNRRNVTCVVT